MSTVTLHLEISRDDLVTSTKPEKKKAAPSEPPLSGWKRYLGFIYCLLSTNSFSLSSVILKKYSSIHPFNVGVWASPLAIFFYVPFIIYTIKVEKKSVLDSFWPVGKHKKVFFFVCFRTLVSSIIPITLIVSLRYISVADLRTILAAAVITVFLFGWMILDEKCGVVPIIVAMLALCGIGVMARPPILTGAEEFDNDTLIGVGMALVSLLLVTMILIMLRYLRSVHQGVMNFILYVWAFVQSLVLALVFEKLEVPSSLTDIAALAVSGLLMATGNLFIVLALQVEEAGVVGLIKTSEVLFTFFWQFVILSIVPDWVSIIGAVFVVTGVIVVVLRKWVASLSEDNANKKRLNFLLM